MNTALVTVLGAAVASSEPAAAHEGVDWLLVGSLFTNFFILFGLLAYFLVPAMKKGLVARRESMASRLEEAAKREAAAEAKLKEYEERLANLDKEIEKVTASYEKQAEADRERLESETEAALARLAKESEVTIDQETRKAERTIRSVAVEATLEAAERKINERIDASDHGRLTEMYVSNLEGTPS